MNIRKAAVPLIGSGLLLAACSSDQFEIIEIETLGDQGVSATIELCGRSTPMERIDGSLRASVRINCEDVGHINVRIGNRQLRCRVGYVTSGMEQQWRYRIRDGQCESLPSLRGPR